MTINLFAGAGNRTQILIKKTLYKLKSNKNLPT